MKKIIPAITYLLFAATNTVHAAGYLITQTLPGTDIKSGASSTALGGIVGYAANLWMFGISIGGVLALASIVFGGIQWTVSAGNESKITDAKDRITQAVIGLVLLFGAYTILSFINPDLTNLSKINKALTNIDPAPEPEVVEAGSSCVGCFPIPNNVVTANLIKSGACPADGCKISPEIQGALQNLIQNPPNSIGWEIVQAFPPASSDSSDLLACHTQQGVCIDIALKPAFYENDQKGTADACTNLQVLLAKVQQAGFGVQDGYADTAECEHGGSASIESGLGQHLHLFVHGFGVTGGTANTCPATDLPPISDPEAQAFENGDRVTFSAPTSDQGVQDNLNRLLTISNRLTNLVSSDGGVAKITSVYRPLAYQQHLFDIFDRWVTKRLQNYTGSDSACLAIKDKVGAEYQKHGLGSTVSQPDKCTSPHVRGTGIDIKITGSHYDNSNPANANAVNSLLTANQVNLSWQALPGDVVHFNLTGDIKKPSGCP